MRAIQNAGGNVGLSARNYPIAAATAIQAGQVVKLCADSAMQLDVDDALRGHVFTVQDALFWIAFVLTRPLGATVGDLLDKPLDHGGLALSRYTASIALAVAIAAITALRHTVYADFEKLFSFELKEELLEPLSLASERYIAYMTQKDYPTLQFYKTIINQ